MSTVEAKRTILVVDDQINTLKVLMAILADEGYAVLEASAGRRALELYREHPEIDVVLADLKMPGMSGLELYRRLGGMRPAPPFVIMTAHATVQTAVQALKEGVTDYLIKPLDYEELTIILDRACRHHQMSRELAVLRRQVHTGNHFHGIIGASRPMQELFELVRTVAPTDAPVLIRGETGTGKELFARSIHRESKRRDHPQVCINCAAVAESLLEAELFGYVKGAFTGAAGDKPGRLETAQGGTLFLDEIGKMSLSLQAKLLRFLQDGSFEPVGATRSRRVDVRLVAATNLDLARLIDQGLFLSDLLYRIEVITIQVPPLRERVVDIPLLVEHFVDHFSSQYEKPLAGVTPEAMQALMDYPWPGNVRELENCLARAVILCKGSRLGPSDLPEHVAHPGRPAGPGRLFDNLPEQGLTLAEVEGQLIARTLEQCRGNKTLAARRLGISRKGLYEKIQRLGLKKGA